MVCGVYRIASASGKIYIGSSIDVDRRIRDHFFFLKRGKHPNSGLQEVFDNEEITHSLILECPEESRFAAEQFFINLLDTAKVGLGVSAIAGVGVLAHTPETKLQIGESVKIWMSNPDNRKQISNSLKGRPRSLEVKAKIAKSHLGISRPHTEETKAKISTARKGKKHSEETKAKLRFAWASGKYKNRDSKKS